MTVHSTTSRCLPVFVFALLAAPKVHAQGNEKLQNLNYWMTAQAGFFGCAEAALKGVVVAKLDSNKYEVAATTLGENVPAPHVILKTRKTKFASRGSVVICVNKKYGYQRVKTNDGFSDTWMVVTEGELNEDGKTLKRMNEDAVSRMKEAAEARRNEGSKSKVDEMGVDSVVAANEVKLLHCVKGKAQSGKYRSVRVEFTIPYYGSVSKLLVDDPVLTQDTSFSDCLLKEVQQWQFQPEHVGKSVSLHLDVGKNPDDEPQDTL